MIYGQELQVQLIIIEICDLSFYDHHYSDLMNLPVAQAIKVIL